MEYREKAYQLARSLMNTEEYRRLLKAKKEISSNSDLSKMITEYSKRQSALFTTFDPTGIHQQLKKLNNEFARLLKYPEARLYFEAAREFNRLMAITYRYINDILDSGMR